MKLLYIEFFMALTFHSKKLMVRTWTGNSKHIFKPQKLTMQEGDAHEIMRSFALDGKSHNFMGVSLPSLKIRDFKAHMATHQSKLSMNHFSPILYLTAFREGCCQPWRHFGVGHHIRHQCGG